MTRTGMVVEQFLERRSVTVPSLAAALAREVHVDTDHGFPVGTTPETVAEAIFAALPSETWREVLAFQIEDMARLADHPSIEGGPDFARGVRWAAALVRGPQP